MSFLVPAFLAGFAALLVPVLLHLRDRNEETPTRFPSLMFLVRLPIRSSDKRRITDWPLLLLRALAVALLVLAFSRPFVGGVATAASGERVRAVVLAIDHSMSMGHGGTWTAARDSARAVLDGLRSGDHVALVTFHEEATVAQGWTTDHAAVRGLVDALAPMPRGTRFGAGLRAARGLLAAAPPAAPEAVLVSDLQRSGLSGTAGLEWPDDAPLRTVVVGDARRPNTSILAVDARRTLSAARVTVQVQARIVARELPAPRTVRAALELGGREVASRSVELPTSGERTVVFDAVAAPVGAVSGAVRLDADALPTDDRFHFTLAAEDELRVIAVVPADLRADETLFFERALAIGRAPGVRVERRREGTLDAATLDRAGLVLFWDLAPASGAATEALRTWLRAGGGVAVHVGPRLGARRGALPFGTATVAGVADRREAGGAVIGEHRSEHPLFAPFRATPAALGAPRLWRYPRLEPAVGTEVLARLDDGAPALLERREGDGRVLVNALPLDTRDGDLPLQPAFLPLMRRLALHVSGFESLPVARETGEAWVARGVRRDPLIVSPGGALLRPGAESGLAAVALDEPGIYTAYEGRADGAPRALVAVNPPSEESDLTQSDPRELLLGVGGGANATAQQDARVAALELEGRQRLWRTLLLIAAGALLAETVVGALGWRGYARRATIEGGGAG